MSANSFGQRLVMTSFGESHGPALGVVIDGCPAGLEFNSELLRLNLARRRPGASSLVSARAEKDEVQILSGVHENKTLGTPIAMIVQNKDQRAQDYQDIAQKPRIGHADQTWKMKFSHTDPRGGGRSSGRETLARVMAGSVGQMLLQKMAPSIVVKTFLQTLGPHHLNPTEELKFLNSEQSVYDFESRFPSDSQQARVNSSLQEAKQNGDSFGAVVRVIVQNAPPGLGQPVFHKLKADIAMAMMGIGATAAIEIGAGLESSSALGTHFHSPANNPYGGIQGGISNGQDISVNIHFKPTSSILDVAKKGRHDPCIAIRAVTVVESMFYFVLADHFLWNKTDNI